MAFWYIEQNNNRKINPNDDMQGSYLGPEYSQSNIEKSLKEANAVFEILNDEEILEKTSESLQNGNAIGWFQGRMEFGPRALGARSILGDPRSQMQKNLNLKVKFRESQFAPSIIFEDISEWFELNEKSPYMLLVANINEKIKTEMTNDQKKLFGID